MKYYRLVDDVLQPYYSGYNDTSLKDLAESIYDIAYDFRDEEHITSNIIYEWLEKWDRDFAWIYVEEQDEPFDETLLDLYY